MSEIILKDYGWCQITNRHDKYYIRYDKGGIAVEMVENEVSKNEADRALVSQEEAEKIVIQIQKNKKA